MLEDECRTCAWYGHGCGRDIVPTVVFGECGHCDGCLDYAPIAARTVDDNNEGATK